MDERERLLNIFLDKSVSTNVTPEVMHEYNTAVADLLQENYFHLCKNPGGPKKARGPYNLHLRIVDGRLVLDIRRLELGEGGELKEVRREEVSLPISPLRRIVRDYFFICGSYYDAVRSTSPVQLETVDMAKRGLHNEGAETLSDILHPDIEVDKNTARRLFTLVCVLHLK